MSPRIGVFGELSAKATALAFVLFFLALGLIGLVLPIIPGLLFLIVAAWLVGRHFPAVSSRLRGNRTLARHLDGADDFMSLRHWDKLKLAGLMGLKATIDGCRFVAAGARCLVSRARARFG